eukprot:UN29412
MRVLRKHNENRPKMNDRRKSSQMNDRHQFESRDPRIINHINKRRRCSASIEEREIDYYDQWLEKNYDRKEYPNIDNRYKYNYKHSYWESPTKSKKSNEYTNGGSPKKSINNESPKK